MTPKQAVFSKASAAPAGRRRADGWFGEYGGRYVAETLMPLLLEVERCWNEARCAPAFWRQWDLYARDYVGRPSPLYEAERLASLLAERGRRIRLFLKREDLNHTGAHKINNCLGQAMLAMRMGKTRIIAETGAGQHGVATATVCARFNLRCVIYMGELDMRRQAINVARMRLLGADVRPVRSGSRVLKDALNEAMRDWVTHVDETFYIIGSVAGPHPYPGMVRELQSVIGREARQQCLQRVGRPPDLAVACVGGGSNAIGLFGAFLNDATRLVGVEAGGEGLDSGRHSAALAAGRPGILHGNRTCLLQDDDGQILNAHSIAAGLDYPGVGPEHAWLRDQGRARYETATDDEALAAFRLTCRLEGIPPALETAHALAYVLRPPADMRDGEVVLLNLSGRGDKDAATVAAADAADAAAADAAGKAGRGDRGDQ